MLLVKESFRMWMKPFRSGVEAGKVNISESTHKLIKTHFECTSRGMIPIKNRGEIEMIFVNN